VRSACALAVILAISGAARAEPEPKLRIIEFRVEGPSKTSERTMAYLAHVAIGDKVGPSDIKRLERDLLSSELFEKVTVTLEEAPGGVIVVAHLDDKHSWIVAPTLFVLPSNLAVGAGFAENNLRGHDQKLLLYGQVGNRTSLFFGTFLDPSFRGSKWTARFDLYAYRRREDEYANPPDDPESDRVLRINTTNYLGGGVLVGYTFAWWEVLDFRLRGGYAWFGTSHAPDGTPLPVPEKDGRDITLQTHLTLDQRGHHYGVTWGPYLQLTLEASVPGLDDFGYEMGLLRAYYSWRLFAEHELHVRTNLHAGYHLPYQEELLMGGPLDLRGYSTDQFRGDTRLFFRLEYSVPLFKWRIFAFRALGFWDGGYAGRHFSRTTADRNFILPEQENGQGVFRDDVGGGLRIYVRNIVLPLLGLDFGYGIEGHSPEVVFEVGLTDF
jgi:outer membrane protein assembly factor BamA